MCVFLRFTHCKTLYRPTQTRFCGCYVHIPFRQTYWILYVVFALFLCPLFALFGFSFSADAFRFCQVSRHFTSTYLDFRFIRVFFVWIGLALFTLCNVEPRDVFAPFPDLITSVNMQNVCVCGAQLAWNKRKEITMLKCLVSCKNAFKESNCYWI